MPNMDSVFVNLEDPANLMVITGVMILGAPVNYAHLGVAIEHRILRFDRFRQRGRVPLAPGHMVLAGRP